MAPVPLPGGDPAPPAGSVTAWIHDLRGGDADAAGRLWARYFREMVRFSRARLSGTPTRAADEEDVALSAFDSFCRGAGAGRFPHLLGRDDLWKLLARIMANKAANWAEHERCRKRGGGAARADASALAGVADAGPGPELAAQMAEEFDRLLGSLPDESMRRVALLRFQGHSVEEIARELGCGVRTVERKLLFIRRIWEGAAA